MQTIRDRRAERYHSGSPAAPSVAFSPGKIRKPYGGRPATASDYGHECSWDRLPWYIAGGATGGNVWSAGTQVVTEASLKDSALRMRNLCGGADQSESGPCSAQPADIDALFSAGRTQEAITVPRLGEAAFSTTVRNDHLYLWVLAGTTLIRLSFNNNFGCCGHTDQRAFASIEDARPGLTSPARDAVARLPESRAYVCLICDERWVLGPNCSTGGGSAADHDDRTTRAVNRTVGRCPDAPPSTSAGVGARRQNGAAVDPGVDGERLVHVLFPLEARAGTAQPQTSPASH